MEVSDIMSKIAILTDSSCDIPQELADKYGVGIHMHVAEAKE